MCVSFLSRVSPALLGKFSIRGHDAWPQSHMLGMLQMQVSQAFAYPKAVRHMSCHCIPCIFERNDAGLSCDAQTLLGSQYPAAAAGKDNMEAILLCRWALEGFATIDEIQEGLKSVQLPGLQSESAASRNEHHSFEKLADRSRPGLPSPSRFLPLWVAARQHPGTGFSNNFCVTVGA